MTTPTLFVVPVRGVIPAYERDLFARLPPIKKRLVEVDDGVFWMCTHHTETARVLADWFLETV